MATNGTNTTEDAEMGEYDGDKVVTMLDVLQEEQDFEEDANAVLGASDDKNCSYNKGYVKRQAIYACMTCTDAKIDPLKRAGVCLACSLTCHENHELIELYTKRNFRCDCGNPKFNSHPCQFNPNKTDLNEDNKYNQNYSGLYCTCHRPYPDPEATVEDEMIQCIICEDWLHASHLDAVVPDEPYSEMICKDCMEKNNFLHDYSILAITTENVEVDISTSDIAQSNGVPESQEISEKSKDEDFEMKDEADINLDEKKCTEGMSRTENKNEAIVNTERDTIKDSTNEVKSEENNVTSSKPIPEIDETEITNIETVVAKTEEQLKEDKVSNVVSDNNTQGLNQDKGDCESNRPDNNKIASVNEDIIENGTRNDEKEGKTPTTLDTNITNATKGNSPNDVTHTHVDQPEDITDNDLRMEEELLKDPTEIDPEIKSITESDKEPASGTSNETAMDSTNETALDAAKESTIDTDNEPSENTPNEAVINTTNETPNERVMDTTNEPAVESTSESVLDTIKEPGMNTGNDTNIIKTTEPTENATNESAVDTTNQPAVDTTSQPAVDTTSQPAVDTTNETEMDITTEPVTVAENIPPTETSVSTKEVTEMDVEKVEEGKSSNADEQKSGPDNSETNSELNSKVQKADTKQDEIFEDDTVSKEDSINIEKNSTKDEEINLINDKGSNVDETVANSSNENKRKLSVEDTDDNAKRIKPNEHKSCIRPKGIKRHLKGATFWPQNFRQKLCTCNECLSMYKDLSVLFLIDSEDTVAAYEMLGKERSNGNSQYEKGLQALSSLDRIQQINAVTEYNKLREKLSDFLKSFMLKKEIVKEEDIKAFFAGMKPKREPDGVYFCR